MEQFIIYSEVERSVLSLLYPKPGHVFFRCHLQHPGALVTSDTQPLKMACWCLSQPLVTMVLCLSLMNLYSDFTVGKIYI